MLNTGIAIADRLLENIKTSLALRSKIPDLQILKDLIDGGAVPTGEMMNTSSNFGSFDTALMEVIKLLHGIDKRIMEPPAAFPLPLTAIYSHLFNEFKLLAEILQDCLKEEGATATGFNSTPALLLRNLELVNSAAV